MTPSAAARPNAEPPVRTTASTRATSFVGSRSAVSRDAGAPPRTSTDPNVPSGGSTTVIPVPAPVQLPTRTPATSVMAFSGPGVSAPGAIPMISDPSDKAEGIFTLVTDAEIVMQNQEDGPKVVGHDKVISWTIGTLKKDAPTAVLRMKN